MLNRMMFRLLFALLILSLQACATTYSANPITARVVDAQTNEPIENVVVVAHWQLEGGLEGGNNLGQMMVMEAVTDPAGRFNFPAWGPKTSPIYFNWVNINARLKTMAPAMVVFKSGYEYQVLANDLNEKSFHGKLDIPLKSDWDGKTIKLKKFEGDLKGYVDVLSFLGGRIDFAMDNCDWKKIPRMLIAVDKQARLFQEAKVYSSLPNIEYITQDPRGQCGSAQEFWKDYLK